MATNTHISVRGARRRTVVVIALSAALVAVGLDKTVTSSRASGRVEVAASYHWPVKPFDRQHPVRGNFGDPRTVFTSSPTLRGVLSGACSCSLHRGIDVAAPDGSPVYPVASGTVTYADGEWLKVDSGGGRGIRVLAHQPDCRRRRARRGATGLSSATSSAAPATST